MLKPTKRELRINHLEEVRDKEEAKKSNLQRKTKIRTLQFEWSDGREVGCNDVEVLEGLEPHPNMEGIRIENYLGEKFPPWLLMMKIPSDGDSSRVFDNLVELMLRTYLPTATAMRLLSKLTRLRIGGCPFLRENCTKGSGSEWSKISHLPDIVIQETGLRRV
ncbi:hypothetical protein GH714_037748 [Hevea brasiliensis]|uniref:R13L1/DRL21-like LRR repeat region domain-containing protein n=1 Tax=Hevea brasiliensis TaxID=3981 RepID=A0A6A6L9U0_HEVBR|nr:hypothetical protein GH714_037748 [Hevea brasiliensis]